MGPTYVEKDVEISRPYREQYLNGIKKVIERRTEEVKKLKGEYINPEKLKADPEKYRKDFADMLGWPLNCYEDFKDVPMTARRTQVAFDSLGYVYRVEIEVMPDLWFYGMMFHSGYMSANAPFIIFQHGGGGTPELAYHCDGNESNYNHVIQRFTQRGAVVFAPQLLLWDKNIFKTDYDRMKIDESLQQLGGSITALEIFCIRRAIDYFTKYRIVTPDRIAMVGLSYGGFYTLRTAAVEPRIRCAYTSSHFNDRFKYQSSDWVFRDSGLKFVDAEIAGLVAPRPLYVGVGERDPLFGAEDAKAEAERAREFFKAYGCEDKFKFDIFDGDHMFSKTDEGIEFVLNNLPLERKEF